MQKTLIKPNVEKYPEKFRPLLRSANVYDSSSSKDARMLFIDTGCGYYLKYAALGTLRAEAELTGYFNKKGLGTQVIDYLSESEDWLLVRRMRGEDCTSREYLSDPLRLCDTLAEAMLMLHSESFADCPEKNRTAKYLMTVRRNYDRGMYDTSLENGYPRCKEEALRIIEDGKDLLKSDTLIHGDFCLPNIMLDGWRLSGFIDLGCGGVGDRHIDLFWCAWSLRYNLGTDKYRDRLFDAYGREKINEDALRIVKMAEAFG